ncbi:MAG: hypothetical protein LBF76_00155 [Holosporales bacterium]|nr:hypothetical protein [Holosporales bacterium]
MVSHNGNAAFGFRRKLFLFEHLAEACSGIAISDKKFAIPAFPKEGPIEGGELPKGSRMIWEFLFSSDENELFKMRRGKKDPGGESFS